MLTHTIKNEIKAPLEKVYSYLADLRQYGMVHPYMVQVTEIDGRDKEARYYNVKERFLLYGFIPMRPTYDAKVLELAKLKHVQYVSDVMSGVHLTIDFTFAYNTNTGNTEVTEFISLEAPIVIGSVFMGILKRAHDLFYNQLKENCK
ncbi:hypothetical protein CJD36_014145 [Flavipsychrobacter stenotrophus]|uniref:SRPBCC family protein n=1 Tax=Flavipsychrobacter stenotrophus TaxID=2077091 RepID=A0A2S7SWZ1_9BACT|nr:SRPBCC family protein [Flavipsychrobacter stenotrophus]PQJ11105.1 hypothetical protein CJD36_014145 [Flavipsychrobacter stenotrophus]